MDEARVLKEIRIPPGARKRVMNRGSFRSARRCRILEASVLPEFDEDMERPVLARFLTEINQVDVPRHRQHQSCRKERLLSKVVILKYPAAHGEVLPHGSSPAVFLLDVEEPRELIISCRSHPAGPPYPQRCFSIPNWEWIIPAAHLW